MSSFSIATRWSRWPRWAASLGAVLAVGLAASLPAASASTSAQIRTPKAAKVTPDYKYFRGKTITLVADGAAGGSTDVQYRAVAPVLGALLHCTVVVQDNPTGAGFGSQDAVYASKPDGLTIGSFSGDQDVTAQAEHLTGVNFPLKKVIQLGGAGQPESLIVSSSSGPSTLKGFLYETSPTIVLQTTGSSFSIIVNMLIAAYHDVPAHVVYGYSSSSNLVQGFERGDGPVMGTAEHPMQSILQAGIARPLMLSVKPWPSMPLYSQLQNIPYLDQLPKLFPPKTTAGRAVLKGLVSFRDSSVQSSMVAPGTPAKIVLALQDSWVKVFANPSVKTALTSQGLSDQFFSVTKAEQGLATAIKDEPLLAKFLAGTSASS